MFRNSLPLVILSLFATARADEAGQPWQRHTIDDTARGADGVRLADANGDGLADIATGWEEAGLVRLYLNPGTAKAKEPWPQVTVGKVKSPEDAVLVDLDGDGGTDVVSCCEGNTRSVFVHWGPADKTKQLDPAAWQTEAILALAGKQLAMYCLPVQIDGQHGVDLVIGAKGNEAKIGWLQSPAIPRDLAAWQYHPLCDAGWIMSLRADDFDGDGDQDVLASDRKGKEAGCFWLENPGKGDEQLKPWFRHRFGPRGVEVMFLDHHKAGNGFRVIVPSYNKRLFDIGPNATSGRSNWWDEIRWPKNLGNGKGVRVADINLDGGRDVVLSSENYEGTSGLVWAKIVGPGGDPGWTLIRHEISGPAGPKGMKMDDVQLADLDGDGDLDVLTTEERTGFGVCWFENPTR